MPPHSYRPYLRTGQVGIGPGLTQVGPTCPAGCIMEVRLLHADDSIGFGGGGAVAGIYIYDGTHTTLVAQNQSTLQGVGQNVANVNYAEKVVLYEGEFINMYASTTGIGSLSFRISTRKYEIGDED